MIERDLNLKSTGVKLAGTLCLPDEQELEAHASLAGAGFDTSVARPMVLMVHGSGPLDRNENARNQVLNAFNAMAHYLAKRGIASLRYDKRGCGDSGGDYFSAGHSDLVDDALGWVRLLARQPECDPSALFVLGHSEGTAIAAQVSLRYPSLAGLVLLCPFLQNLEQVLMQQARVLERELTGGRGLRGVLPGVLFRALGVNTRSQARTIAKIKKSSADTLRVRMHKVPARWYRELFALDLGKIYPAVTAPMLILGGGKDLQCEPLDVPAIAELVQGEVTAEVVPDLTHLLRLEPGEPSLVGARRLLKKPLEPLVLEAVSIWLQEQVANDR